MDYIAQITTMISRELVIPASLTVVIAVMVMQGDRQKWILVDGLFMIISGALAVLFPESMLRIILTGEMDQATLLMARLSGLMMIGSALVSVFTRETRDGTVSITLLMSRVFSYSLLLMCQCYTLYGTSRGKKDVNWNDNMLPVEIYGTFLLFLANLYFLIYSDDFSTYPQYNIRINTHLRVDAGLALMQAVLFLALPDFVIGFMGVKATSCALLHITRCSGIFLLQSVIISLQAPGFLHEKDKRAQFSARLITQLLQLFPLIFMVVWYETMSKETLAKISLVFSPIIINAAFGVFADGTVIYRVPKAKSN